MFLLNVRVPIEDELTFPKPTPTNDSRKRFLTASVPRQCNFLVSRVRTCWKRRFNKCPKRKFKGGFSAKKHNSESGTSTQVELDVTVHNIPIHLLYEYAHTKGVLGPIRATNDAKTTKIPSHSVGITLRLKMLY